MRQNNLRFLHGTATVREKNGGNKAFYCVRKKEFTMAWIPLLLHAAHYTRGNINEQDERSVTKTKALCYNQNCSKLVPSIGTRARKNRWLE